MKQILLKSVMLVFALMCSVGLWAQTEEKVTSTFTNTSWAVGDEEPAWTQSGAFASFFYKDKGVVISLSSVMLKALTLTNETIKNLGTITGVTITLTSNSPAGRISVKVGETTLKNGTSSTYMTQNATSAKNVSFTPERGVSGDIVISFTATQAATGSNYVYVKSIAVTYIPFPEVPVSNYEYATYYNSEKYVMPAGLTGKIMEESAGAYSATTIYEAGDVVPAKTALLLNGNEGIYTFKGTNDAPDNDKAEYVAAHNLLRGTLEEATTTGGSASAKYYKLANGENGLGWYYGSADNTTGAAFTIGANKCYLVVDDDAGAEAAPRFIGLEGDDETAIKSISTTPNKNDAIYNMAGQRVGNDYKGIVIKNGNKYLNK